MPVNGRNIYKNNRALTNLSQEAYAERIGVSPAQIYRYETGVNVPPDDVVMSMAELSGDLTLPYRHMLETSGAARMMFPDIQKLPLPQATVQLLLAIREVADGQAILLQLAADGEITEDEAPDWEVVIKNLDAVIKAAVQVKFAEGVG